MGRALDGKVAVVTGAGNGIGRSEALELAAHGAALVVNDIEPAAASAVTEKIKALGGNALAVPGDCSSEDVAARLIEAALSEYGRLDALVNNAGLLRDGLLFESKPSDWDVIFKVHLRGHFAPTYFACRHWRASASGGRIVCTTSTSGLLGNVAQAAYGAAKAGIAAFSTIVAQEMSPFGVTCNAVAPTARTRLTKAGAGLAPAQGFDFWHPDNVAPFVAYLCSDWSAHISGKVFGVSGDAVELYRSPVSAAVIRNVQHRWTLDELRDNVGRLFAESHVDPAPEDMMAKLRFTMNGY